MGHVFISYSHKDTSYAHKLSDSLQNLGINVWIDERLDYGSQWPLEIQKQLDSCDAFIVIMSPRSFASEWVQSELQRAKRKMKAIFPLLLEGDEPWLSVESTQYYDVRHKDLPDNKFYSALRRAVSAGEEAETFPKLPVSPVTTPPPANVRPKLPTGIFLGVGGFGVIIVFLIIMLPTLSKMFNPAPTSSPATATVFTVTVEPSVIASSVPNTSVPGPTLAPVSEPTITSSPTKTSGITGMVLVPQGLFTMGNNKGDVMERPAHSVNLSAYYIDQFEVTNKEYKTCVDAQKCNWPSDISSKTHSNYYDNPEFDDFPVINVTWDMAQSYCAWQGKRLPTEAEWEKAARGTDARTYPWGQDSADCSKANYNACGSDTVKVGSYEAGKSPYGVYDLAGNVWEWVADWYKENYYAKLANNPSNPAGPASGSERVIRGGSWFNTAKAISATIRNSSDPSKTYNIVGFRCAKNATP